MPPGPKPRPVELSQQLGNPGHRSLPDVVLVGGRSELVKPEHLKSYASEAWDELVPLLQDAGLLDRIDSVVFAGLCEFIGLARFAWDKLVSEGYTTTHAKTGVESVSPWARLHRDSWTSALKIAEQYGLTPTGRTRLGLAVLKGRTLMQELEDGFDA